MRMTNFARVLSVILLIFCGSIMFAETFNNVYIGDVGHGYAWAGFGHKDIVGTTGYALLQQNDGSYTLINKRDTGSGYIGFRVENADKMVILNNGNVGIGTTAPGSKFQVNGLMRCDTEYSGIVVDWGTVSRVGFMKYPGYEGSLVAGNTTPLRLGHRTDSNDVTTTLGTFRPELVIDTAGNVGIGTTSPSAVLDINGGATQKVLNVNGTANPEIVLANSGTTKLEIGVATTNNAFITNSLVNDVIFRIPGNKFLFSTDAAGVRNDFTIVNGKVGIGTTSPVYPLVAKAANGTFAISATDGSINVAIGTYSNSGWLGTQTNNSLNLVTNNASRMYIDTTGNVCIGTTTPTKILTVQGDGYFSGIVTTGSSRTLKKDISSLSTDEALSALEDLKPVKFKYIADKTETQRLGFIAEDVPELVAEKDRRSLSDMNLTALAITVIQKQQKQIDMLMKEVEKLKSSK